VLRFDKTCQRAYHQSFNYETEDENVTIANALRELNRRNPVTDTDGQITTPVKWECSCLQRRCGSCAMLVNGTPCLACDTKLNINNQTTVELAPLMKFPVVEDLIVNRSALFENLKKLRVWFNGDANTGEQNTELAFDASRCLKCGCCLEICISFMPGEEFAGNTARVAMSRLLSQIQESQKDFTYTMYMKHIHEGCDQYNACHIICPAGIDTARLMSHFDAVVTKHISLPQ